MTRTRALLFSATAMAAPLALALPFALAPAALAQHEGHTMPGPAASPHAGHAMPGVAKPAAAMTEATKAFTAANDRMHAAMAAPLTGNANVDFAKGMIPHHQGAIDMAQIVLEFGKDPAALKLARGIIASQKGEIAQMQAWLAKNGSPAPLPRAEESKKAFAAITMKMHADMALAYTGKADVDFIAGMIPHHEAAVAMAKVLLDYGTDQELRALAGSIISSQSSEIDMMRSWLTKARG
jgi:uncharacterized protein (DUF305 family)